LSPHEREKTQPLFTKSNLSFLSKKKKESVFSRICLLQRKEDHGRKKRTTTMMTTTRRDTRRFKRRKGNWEGGGDTKQGSHVSSIVSCNCNPCLVSRNWSEARTLEKTGRKNSWTRGEETGNPYTHSLDGV
jgi:hypothetical protein